MSEHSILIANSAQAFFALIKAKSIYMTIIVKHSHPSLLIHMKNKLIT